MAANSYRTVLANAIEKMNMVADAGSYLLIHKDEIVKALRSSQCGTKTPSPELEMLSEMRRYIQHPLSCDAGTYGYDIASRTGFIDPKCPNCRITTLLKARSHATSV